MTMALEFVRFVRQRNSLQWKYDVHGKAAQLTLRSVELIRKLLNFYAATTKMIYIFKNSAHTSQRTNSASITKTNR